MQMVGMGLVIIRRQGGCENIAGAVADRLEKARSFVIRVPVAGDRDAAPVGEAEGGDVDRIGGRMFAEIAALAAANPPAAVAAIGDDLRDRGAEMFAGRGFDDLIFPQHQTGRHRAAGLRGGAIGDGSRLVPGQGDAIGIAAIRPGADRGQGAIAYRSGFEQAVALRRIVGERIDLAGGKRPDRIGQRQRRPGHAVVVADPFIAAQEQRQKDDKKDDPEGDGRKSCSGRAGVGDVLFNRRERKKFPSCAACRDPAPIGLTRSHEAAKRLFPFSREGEGYEALPPKPWRRRLSAVG